MSLFSNYKIKLMLIISLSTLVVLIGIAKLTTSTLSKTTKQVFSDRAEFIVRSATEAIDGDTYEAFIKSLDMEDEWYQSVCQELHKLQAATGCQFLYAMAQVKGYDFMMILDGEDPESEDFSEPGAMENVESYGYGPIECMKERRMIVSDVDVSDEWGWVQSVYSPIINSSGKPVGIIGCDFDATELRELMINAKMQTYAICCISTLLIALITFFTMSVFFKNLKGVTNAIEQMSAGDKDLTAQIPVVKNNEIGVMSKACNNLMENLRVFIGGVKQSTNNLAENTNRITEDSVQVAELTASASEKFKTISSKAQIQNEINTNAYSEMESVNKDVNLLSEHIKKQNEAVENSYSAIQTITSNVVEVDSTIQKIAEEYSIILNESVEGRKKQDDVASLLVEIEEVSDQLTEANTVISGIAEQTNLLAMNAAIEAAHAGEEGKGFGVVADEIRKLAETSAEQTNSIEKLISETRNSISEIIHSSEDSSNTFNSLADRIKKTGEMVQNIRSRIEEQNEQAENISSLMKILSNVEEDINTSSQTMNDAIQRAKNIVIESKKVSDEILDFSRQTSIQMDNVQKFSAESAKNSRNNQQLVNNVNEAINQYKTER